MKFCKSDEKENPVKEFLDALPTKDAQKVIWVLKLADEADWIPAQYFFREENENLWEIRITVEVKNYWMLAFQFDNEWILCNADFSTDTQKALEKEKKAAHQKVNDYKAPMTLLAKNDLEKYIKKRKKKSKTFGEDFDKGYLHFKIGAILRQARQKAGLTQAQIADKLEISSSSVSRIENHADELDISALENYVQSWSNKLKLELTE